MAEARSIVNSGATAAFRTLLNFMLSFRLNEDRVGSGAVSQNHLEALT
jgi:hypothetical protein